MNTTSADCYVYFESWAGKTKHAAEFLGETKTGRYKVRLIESAFRHSAGKILYPPKDSVVLNWRATE